MSIKPEQLAELEKAFDRLESAQNSHDPESHEPPDRTDEINADMEAVELLWEYRRELIAAARELEELKAKIAKSSLIEVEATKCVSRSGHPVIVKDGTMLVHKDYLIEAQDKTKRMQAHAATARKCHAAEQDRDQWKERAEKAESSIQDLVKAKGRYNTQLAYEKLALSASAPPGCDFPDPPVDGAPTA